MSQFCNIVAQSFPGKPTYSTEEIPDLSGKVMIVTGGNTGIGKETIKALLTHNAKVYMAARSKSKAEAAIQDLKDQTGKESLFLELDLSNLASVRKSAEEYLSKEKELNVLFNNAGLMFPPLDQITADGYDIQFGTNVLGPFLFTKLLIPTLIAGSQSSSDHKSRIITTSSQGHYFYNLNWDTFVDGPTRKNMTTENLYYQSKFANVVIARELAQRYGEQGIVSISVNPGNIKTDLQRHVSDCKNKLANALHLLSPTEYGALTQLYAGTAVETAEANGKYFMPWAKEGEPNKAALDPQTGERLWGWCEEQVKKF
ncbi:hypothetical protein JAAARDRAFT_268980 [Jaapia argillacea MUCL 33604]|uniref:NAD(P)-binding protein n=1 Tax=Jaapia argillacea MUCL 33604 TaxID=933084 RepID=A0A067PUQ1_9AGAM|nr:hypothetical protein JAAARDRAFT_268980 [Jaapia argillacea MUCL 33604]